MRIHFQNTLEDYRELLRTFPLRKRLEWTLAFPLWLVAAAVPGTAFLIFLGDWYALAAGWVLLVTFNGWYVLRVLRSWRNLDPKALAPASVWFDDASVSSESGYGWSRRDWTLIHEVRETSSHILLFTAEAEAFVIPRRAFASGVEADELAAAAHATFARSREPGYVPYSPPLPAETASEMLAGIVSALQVRYQNTAEELVRIQFYGLANSDPLSTRIMAWCWLAVFGGFVVWIACQRSSPWQQWEVGQIASFIICIFLLVVEMQLWHKLQAWKAKRRTDPRRLAPQVLTITPAGVFGQSALYEHGNDWSVVDEIAENDRLVVLYLIKPRFLAAVPKTAFASLAEAQQFVLLARNWKLGANEAATRSLPPVVDSGNPYQSPAEL